MKRNVRDNTQLPPSDTRFRKNLHMETYQKPTQVALFPLEFTFVRQKFQGIANKVSYYCQLFSVETNPFLQCGSHQVS
jgi:hypothetical protein